MYQGGALKWDLTKCYNPMHRKSNFRFNIGIRVYKNVNQT